MRERHTPLAIFTPSRERRATIEPQESGLVDGEVVEVDAEPGFLARLLHTEPALIRGFVAASLVLLVSFNVPITGAQQASVLGVTAALLMLVQAWSTRQSVYSPASVDEIDDEADAAIEDAYRAGIEDAEGQSTRAVV